MFRLHVQLAAVGLVVAGCGDSGSTNEGTNAPPPPPTVNAFSPESGPFGSEVTIVGSGLGSSNREGVMLAIGDDREYVIDTDYGGGVIQEWSEVRIRLRVPFPVQGPFVLETPQGSAAVGSFEASWIPGPATQLGPAQQVISSVSPGVGRLAVFVSGGDARLLEFSDSDVTTVPAELGGADPESVQLFVNASAEVEGLALTANDVVHLTRDASGLTAVPTGLGRDHDELLLAGGFVWLRDDGDWSRASAAGGFVVDLGPVPDPAPSSALSAAAATADGALHVLYSHETGNLFDDMEAPYMATLAADSQSFAVGKSAGKSVDDYLTELTVASRGYGLIIDYCGSDVDPVLGTPKEDNCYRSVRSNEGASAEHAISEDEQSRYVFAPGTVGYASCQDGLTLGINPNDAELAVWPCPRVLAAELDADGYFLPLVQLPDGVVYAPRKRPLGADGTSP